MNAPSASVAAPTLQTDLHGRSDEMRRDYNAPFDRFAQACPSPIRRGRTNCPACGDTKGALAVTEGDGGKLLLHCFKGCDALAIVDAVGLKLGDLFSEPVRRSTPEERRQAQRFARQAQWAAALNVLTREATVTQVAARMIQAGNALTPNDDARLALAVERIDSARELLR